jgi:hypothetical protein
VIVDDDRVYDEVRDAVARAAVGLRRLERQKATLEDLFLAGTGVTTAAVGGDLRE